LPVGVHGFDDLAFVQDLRDGLVVVLEDRAVALDAIIVARPAEESRTGGEATEIGSAGLSSLQ
jgi:hypothetical protein